MSEPGSVIAGTTCPPRKLIQVIPEEKIVAARQGQARGSFPTMTSDLLKLDDWLASQQIEVIAMESTGVFWRPVFNLLEEGRQVILVNAQHNSV